MAIKILTDSTCDLTEDLLKTYEIEVLPLTVNFGEESFRDGIDIKPEDFFKRLRASDALPFTSQINPAQFEEVFRRRLAEGHEIVGIFISSTFSGTFNSALIAKNSFTEEEQERIHLFDSRTSTMALGLIVVEVAKVLEAGGGIESVCQRAVYTIEHSKIIFVLDTLLYLSKGGRISASQAMIGNLLNVKPILTINENAEIVKVDKVRGKKKGIRWIVDYIKDKGIDLTKVPCALGHGDEVEHLNMLKEQLATSYNEANGIEGCIGAVIGTHLGPGCIGLTYIEEKNK
jgi:DegV family protein with EDD domain